MGTQALQFLGELLSFRYLLCLVAVDMRLGFVAILRNEPCRAAFEACLQTSTEGKGGGEEFRRRAVGRSVVWKQVCVQQLTFLTIRNLPLSFNLQSLTSL